jgi:thiamine monophosphate synthase
VPRLLGVTCGGEALVARVDAALRAGLPAVLLREDAAPPELARLAAHGARVLLHARIPDAEALAASHGFGLHLPDHDDLATRVVAVRARFPGRLSASVHDPDEARRACAAGADLVLLAPIWSPGSKPGDTRPPLGLAALARCGPCAPRVLGLGGVTPSRAAALRAAGAGGAASLGGVFGPGAPGPDMPAWRAWLAPWRDALQ